MASLIMTCAIQGQMANERLEKHVQAQQQLNDAVIKMGANQENMQKTLDKIANKLNVQ